MNVPLLSLLVAALSLSLAAAVTDVRTGLIPNRLVVAGLFLGVAGNLLAFASIHGLSGIIPALLQSVGGVVACAAVPIFLFYAGGLAGGDAKLFLVLGSLLGPVSGLQVQLYAFVVGATYVFGLLAYEGALLRTVSSSVAQVASTVLPRSRRVASGPESARTIRFGPAIFVGTLVVVASRWGQL